MDTLIIPVRIEHADPHHLLVRPQDDIADCPKCARGEGCGGKPWFRGLFANRAALRVPQGTPPLAAGDNAELHLPARILNTLTALTYGAPLAAFLLTLMLTQTLSPALQLLSAVPCAALAHIPAQHGARRLLLRRLRLIPRAHPSPARCP